MLLALVTPLDPLHGDGYQAWSGILAGSPVFVGLAAWVHHHNCIERGCWRTGHPSPEHAGHPVCRKHTKHAHPAFR